MVSYTQHPLHLCYHYHKYICVESAILVSNSVVWQPNGPINPFERDMFMPFVHNKVVDLFYYGLIKNMLILFHYLYYIDLIK